MNRGIERSPAGTPCRVLAAGGQQGATSPPPAPRAPAELRNSGPERDRGSRCPTPARGSPRPHAARLPAQPAPPPAPASEPSRTRSRRPARSRPAPVREKAIRRPQRREAADCAARRIYALPRPAQTQRTLPSFCPSFSPGRLLPCADDSCALRMRAALARPRWVGPGEGRSSEAQREEHVTGTSARVTCPAATDAGTAPGRGSCGRGRCAACAGGHVASAGRRPWGSVCCGAAAAPDGLRRGSCTTARVGFGGVQSSVSSSKLVRASLALSCPVMPCPSL